MRKIYAIFLSIGVFFLCLNLFGCAGDRKKVCFEQVLQERGDGVDEGGQTTGEDVLREETDVSDDFRETHREADDGTKDRDQREDMSLIYVDVTGAVNRPGVVTLPFGARVYEAVAKAGGFSEEAAAELVNQAAVLSDGQQVRVYTRDEAEDMTVTLPDAGNGPAAAGEAVQGKVNINEAAAEELMTLPGIGESKAADIIRYREENGGFDRIEDIMNISGIKEAVFGKIKDKIVTR